MSVQSEANAVMLRLGCAPIVSQGMCVGETFCSQHGQANDVCWGWDDDKSCMFVFNVVNSARSGDTKTLAKMLDWARSG